MYFNVAFNWQIKFEKELLKLDSVTLFTVISTLVVRLGLHQNPSGSWLERVFINDSSFDHSGLKYMFSQPG